MNWGHFRYRWLRTATEIGYTFHVDNLGMAIRAAREAKGMTLRELGRLVDMSFVSVGKKERGEIRVHPSELPIFATALGSSPEELVATASRIGVVDAVQGIPLINVTTAGLVMDYTEHGVTSSDAPSYIDRDSQTQGDRLFALKIVGNSMSPTIEEGDIVVFRSIDPEHDPMPAAGAIVYIHLGNDSAHVGGCCGRLYPLDASTYRIRKDNPQHKAFDVNSAHVDQLAVCIQRRSVPR